MEKKINHIYTTVDKCRICGSKNLEQALSLGEQYIGTTFVKDNETHPMSKFKVPLTLLLCGDCGLVQLKETVNPEFLYRDYYYRTSVNSTMMNDLKELVDSTIRKVGTLGVGDYVVDIGANECAMLGMFPEYLNRVGIEPAQNINWNNLDESISVVNDYFTKESMNRACWGKKAKIITACAMFYDLPNPREAVRIIRDSLDDNGICVIQVSHLLATVKDNNSQDVVHEHLEYYSLKVLERLFREQGLSIFDATLNFVNGGSLRIYVTHNRKNYPKSEQFWDILKQEKEYNLEDIETYRKFQERIYGAASEARRIVQLEIDNGGRVFGLAASTKGNAILQLCGLSRDMIPFISDRNKEKHGLRTLGTNIEVISEEEARAKKPTMMLVLTHHFKNEIVKREREYIQSGGKLMFVMPDLHYVDKFGEHKFEIFPSELVIDD